MTVGSTAALAAAFVACVLSGSSTRAAVTLASDSADDAAYTTFGAFNGLNGGSGFTPWAVTASPTGGSFLNASSNDASGLPGRVFNIFENGTGALDSGITTATRGFAVPLAVGSTFAFSDILHFSRGPDANGNPTSRLGFNLQNAGGTNLLTLAIAGGATGYTLTDQNRSAEQTTLGYNFDTTYTFAVTLNDAAGNYTLAVTGASLPADGVSFAGQIDLTGGAPSAVAIFNNNGGGGSDLQFSNLSITAVPEPAGLAVVAGVLAPLALRRRR